MKNVPGMFISGDGTGMIAQGHYVVCSICNHDAFRISVIYLTNGEHTHVTCTRCKTCFCDNECLKGQPTIGANTEEN